MADQQSADALHLIARIKRIPQLVPYEVEARHSQRDREAGCGQRPSEGKAVVGRRAVHTQLWHIRASQRGVGTALRPPEDDRLDRIREPGCGEAICEAASRPSMRFVTPKTESQQTLSALHGYVSHSCAIAYETKTRAAITAGAFFVYVRSEGLEPPTYKFVACCSIQLSYDRARLPFSRRPRGIRRTDSDSSE